MPTTSRNTRKKAAPKRSTSIHLKKSGTHALSEGKSAPSFRLPDQRGVEVALDSIDTEYTVLYFYPKDDTPGCTLEAREFSKAQREFVRRNAAVLGISGGNVHSKEKFCDKYDLRISLLADENFSVAKRFGAFGLKSFMGRSFKGIHRSTYVLDKNKRIIKVFPKVKPEGHASEVLKFIDEWRAQHGRSSRVRK